MGCKINAAEITYLIWYMMYEETRLSISQINVSG